MVFFFLSFPDFLLIDSQVNRLSSRCGAAVLFQILKVLFLLVFLLKLLFAARRSNVDFRGVGFPVGFLFILRVSSIRSDPLIVLRLGLIQGPVPLPLALSPVKSPCWVRWLDRRLLPGVRVVASRTSSLSVYSDGGLVESLSARSAVHVGSAVR